MDMTTDAEEWRPIPIKPWCDLYEVSNLGRVRHAPRLVAVIERRGYDTVNLRYKAQRMTVGVHRLIAAAFIRAPEKGEVINHINADRSNNRVSNLEWTTMAGNNAHTAKLGRMARFPRHHLAVIDPEVAFEMRRTGHSYQQIGDRFGVTHSAVYGLLKRAIKSGRFKP